MPLIRYAGALDNGLTYESISTDPSVSVSMASVIGLFVREHGTVTKATVHAELDLRKCSRSWRASKLERTMHE